MKNYQKFILLFFIVYSLLGTLLYSRSTISKGDEVHYLITAESIVLDRDLYLENNYSAQILRKFGYQILDKHTVIGRDNHEILAHGFTIFPLILAPFLSIAGKLGVNLFLCLIFILLFKQTVKFCLLITKNALFSWTVSLSIFLTLPLAQYSFLVFPEILAGLLIIYCLYEVLSRNKLSYTSAFLIGLMPWIHFRYITVSAFFILFWFIKQFKKPSKSLLLPPFLIVLYLLTSAFVFGSFNIGRWFMDVGSTHEGNIFANIVNLLIDRQYGLISNNPIFLLTIPGIYFLFRKKRKQAYTLILLICADLLPFIFSNDWNGGFAPPARYLTAIVPIIIPAVVLTLTIAKPLFVKAIWFFGFIWAYIVYLINLFQLPNNGFIYKDGLTPYLTKLSAFTRFNLYPLFPGYFPDDKITLLHLLWMAFILAVSFWVIRS